MNDEKLCAGFVFSSYVVIIFCEINNANARSIFDVVERKPTHDITTLRVLCTVHKTVAFSPRRRTRKFPKSAVRYFVMVSTRGTNNVHNNNNNIARIQRTEKALKCVCTRYILCSELREVLLCTRKALLASEATVRLYDTEQNAVFELCEICTQSVCLQSAYIYCILFWALISRGKR